MELSVFPPGKGIWDTHCHVNAPGRTPSERMARMVQFADRMGIERMCIFMGHVNNTWYTNPTPEQFRETNDDILAILKDWSSRACGFVYLNPDYPKESLDELERCVADGPMVGIKLWTAVRCSSPKLDPIVERAAELKTIVLQHVWSKARGALNLPGESGPADLAALSARHPGMPFIGAHTGGDWELGIRTLRSHPSVFSGISGSEPTAGFVEMAVRELGPERVLYGSDAWGRSFAGQIGKVTSAEISIEQKRMILRDNLRNLLLPQLRKKGITA